MEKMIDVLKDTVVPLYVFGTRLRHDVRRVIHANIPESMEEVPCNVCNSSNVKFLFSKRDRKRYSNIKKFNFMDVVKCENCGFVYVNPRYREDILRDIYVNDLFETYKYEKNHQNRVNVLYDSYHDKLDERKKNFQMYLDVIQTFIQPGKLLDIGTCYGYFLQSAKEKGYDVFGIEPSKHCVEFAKRELGLSHVERGGVADVSFEARSFDVITSWHVIEHLHDPAMFIRKTDLLLRPGGFLFITCPIFERVGFRDIQPTEHLSYFTSNTLKELVARNFRGQIVAEAPIFVFRKAELEAAQSADVRWFN